MKTSGVEVDCSFVTLRLGKIPDKLMAQDEYLFKILVAAGKRAITWRWLQPHPPTKDGWSAIVNQIHCMDKLMEEYDQYVKHWKNYTCHVTCH